MKILLILQTGYAQAGASLVSQTSVCLRVCVCVCSEPFNN